MGPAAEKVGQRLWLSRAGGDIYEKILSSQLERGLGATPIIDADLDHAHEGSNREANPHRRRRRPEMFVNLIMATGK